MNKRWLKLAALPIALSLVAAACGDDDDSSGGDEGSETTEAAGGDDSGDSLGNRVKAAAQVLKEGEAGTQTQARPDEGTRGTRGGF